MTEEKPICVGVVGCGQFMSRQHIQTVARSPLLKLQHVADLDRRKLGAIAERYHPIRSTTDWRNVVADPEVDVVVVGVLPQLHPEIARAAIQSGKPVYVEKPLAETPAECLAIQRMASERGLPVAVGFNRRFAPATQWLRTAFRAASGPVSIVYRISDDDRIRPPDQKWKLECRLLIEVVHVFDLLAYLLQAEPVSIEARETRFNDTMVLVEFDGGSRAVIHSSSWGSLAQPKERLEAVLDRGSVEMVDFVEFRSYGVPGVPELARFAGRPYDGCDNRHVDDFARRGLEAMLEMRQRYHAAMEQSGVLADSSNEQAWAEARRMLGDPPLPQINYASDKGWGQALEHFCQAIAEGRTPENAGAVDGNRATACAVAGRKSIQLGRPVELNPAD
ncbi:MAG: Gfo/Idh/MocA family oxidoreductase [Pirellulales bacterium]|nr:Gfo/Idh/MocA family oxidoreductase [Pirellulales bacterium]